MEEFEKEFKKLLGELPAFVEIEGEIRNTRMGAMSDSYLFIIGVGEVKPKRVETSRTGRHGKRVWILTTEENKKAMFVQFEISNTGKRNVVVTNAPIPEIETWIKWMWIVQQTHQKHIVERLHTLFKNLKLPQKQL
ncbi:MAG: hypothetical protein QXG39_09465, partial [Candidatus Aenigmatarchaeota archaeon]